MTRTKEIDSYPITDEMEPTFYAGPDIGGS